VGYETCEDDDRPIADSSISDRDEAFVGTVIPHYPSLAEDFNRVQEDRDVDRLHHKHHEVKVEEVLPDARLDHPTSTEEVQYDDEDSEDDNYFRYSTGHGSVEPDEDFEKSQDEKVLSRETRTHFATEFHELSSGRQRPTRATRRPTRFRDSEFGTQFRPEEGRKRCNRLGRGDQARGNVDKFYNFHKHRKKKEWYNRLGRGDQQSTARRMTDSSTQSASPSRRKVTTQKLSTKQRRQETVARRDKLAGAQNSCRSLLKRTCEQG